MLDYVKLSTIDITNSQEVGKNLRMRRQWILGPFFVGPQKRPGYKAKAILYQAFQLILGPLLTVYHTYVYVEV